MWKTHIVGIAAEAVELVIFIYILRVETVDEGHVLAVFHESAGLDVAKHFIAG